MPMRIAQLANFFGPSSGGLRTAVNALGTGYLAAGHERFLLVPGPEDSWVTDASGTTVTFRAPLMKKSGYRMVLEPWRVLDVLDQLRPSSVEVSDKTTMLAAARWARKNFAGSVLLSHERLDSHLEQRIRWDAGRVAGVDTVNRLLLRMFDSVVVTSSYAEEEFNRVGTRPVRRIPLGVDLSTFHPSRFSGSSGVVPRLIHVGRLSFEKRPDLAVMTAVALHRQGFAFTMDVYGDGPDRAELMALAGDAPIVFHPYIADRRDLASRIASADVALSVSPCETFGLAILEAQACGTPVVTADRGGGRELVTSASGAFAAPVPSALASAVRDVLSRPASERRLAAREQAERYPWSATVSAMLDVHAAVREDALGVVA